MWVELNEHWALKKAGLLLSDTEILQNCTTVSCIQTCKGAGFGAETDLVTILQMEMRNDMESQGERSVEMQIYVQTFFFL